MVFCVEKSEGRKREMVRWGSQEKNKGLMESALIMPISTDKNGLLKADFFLMKLVFRKADFTSKIGFPKVDFLN